MVYVKKNEQGEVTAVSLKEEPGFSLKDESDDVGGEMMSFLASSRNLAELAASDLEFVRVIDDLLEVLLNKGVIKFTDLPASAQAKFLKRSNLRDRGREALDILEDDGLV